MGDVAKVVLRGKFIQHEGLPQKTRKTQVNNITSHLKQLEKEEQIPKSVEGNNKS